MPPGAALPTASAPPQRGQPAAWTLATRTSFSTWRLRFATALLLAAMPAASPPLGERMFSYYTPRSARRKLRELAGGLSLAGRIDDWRRERLHSEGLGLKRGTAEATTMRRYSEKSPPKMGGDFSHNGRVVAARLAR